MNHKIRALNVAKITIIKKQINKYNSTKNKKTF